MLAFRVLVVFALLWSSTATTNPFTTSQEKKGKKEKEKKTDQDASFSELPLTPTRDVSSAFPRHECGGRGQGCCSDSACDIGLRCLIRGDADWFGTEKRCLPAKVRGRCGVEGLQCCRSRCIGSLVCANRRMCRKPADSIVTKEEAPASSNPLVGSTTAQFDGWLKVFVLARGDKCFVRVKGAFETSVMTFGEGTFGEVFGSLSGMGECEDGAEGKGVGFIRADVLATATLDENGECVADADTLIELQTKIKGDGISITLGGDAGAEVGCNKRKLLLTDLI